MERRADAEARRERAAQRKDDAADGDAKAKALDGLDLVNALCAHHEEPAELVLRWPWKLFCARWAGLYEYLAKKRAEDEEKAEEREREEAFRTLRMSGD